MFSFFPSTFIPSRLHIVACPDIKDCEKMILPTFGKTFCFSSILGARWNLFRNSRKRWLYLHKSAFLSSYSSSYFPLPVKNCVMALILSLVDWLYTSCTVIKWSSLPRCMVFKRQSFKSWLPFSKFSQLLLLLSLKYAEI